MIEVNCYNCGSDKRTFYASENSFKLVKCSGCGLLYVSPRPSLEEIEMAHKFGVHQGTSKLEVTGCFSEKKVKSYFKILRDFYGAELSQGRKSWLDIGCGNGEFILALREFSKGNVLASGLEPNVNKQKSAQDKGLNVSWFDLDNHKEKYDFISLLNVYSHLPNPPESLVRWKRLLKPDGELLLETGDTANFDSQEHYRPFYLPDHLSLASEEIVVNIFEKCGFQVIMIQKYPAFQINYTAIVKEIVKLFWPNKNSMITRLFQLVPIPLFIRLRKKYTDMYIRSKLYTG